MDERRRTVVAARELALGDSFIDRRKEVG